MKHRNWLIPSFRERVKQSQEFMKATDTIKSEVAYTKDGYWYFKNENKE